MHNDRSDFLSNVVLFVLFASPERIAKVLAAQEALAEADDLLIQSQNLLIADLRRQVAEGEDAFHQVVRALDDLGLTQVVNQRVTANLGLDIMEMGEEVSAAPTLRTGETCVNWPDPSGQYDEEPGTFFARSG